MSRQIPYLRSPEPPRNLTGIDFFGKFYLLIENGVISTISLVFAIGAFKELQNRSILLVEALVGIQGPSRPSCMHSRTTDRPLRPTCPAWQPRGVAEVRTRRGEKPGSGAESGMPFVFTARSRAAGRRRSPGPSVRVGHGSDSDAGPPAMAPGVQASLDPISADSLRGHRSFLAPDLLEGRGTPSKGLDLAAECSVARAGRWGWTS